MASIAKIERVSAALAQYAETVKVITWLQENNAIGKDVKPDGLAYAYAIRFDQHKDMLDAVLIST